MAQYRVPTGVGVMNGSTKNERYLLRFGNVYKYNIGPLQCKVSLKNTHISSHH